MLKKFWKRCNCFKNKEKTQTDTIIKYVNEDFIIFT